MPLTSGIEKRQKWSWQRGELQQMRRLISSCLRRFTLKQKDYNMTVLYPLDSTKRNYPGFLAETRVQPSGKLTAEQRADEREVLSFFPRAAREDWSKGLWRNRRWYNPTKRVSNGTCAVIWWAK